MAKYNINNFRYGGQFHDFFWNPSYNANATIENGLANCTTLAIGLCYLQGLPLTVSRIGNANVWDRLLTNGWTSKPYGSVTLKVGDKLQWVEHCHVATVIEIQNGEAILGCSWYTGEHGVSVYDGEFDTRHFTSLPMLSDFMVNNYPYRFYHEATISEESTQVGGLPDNVLVAPQQIRPVDENSLVNQIHVLTNEQNIRDNDNNIIAVAKSGFYDVYTTKESHGYTWYEIQENAFIAGVKGRVIYIPAKSDYEKLKKENEELKLKLKQISEIAAYD